MATHSSILVWKILWTEDPGGLQSMGLQSRTQLTYTHRKKQGRAWLKKMRKGKEEVVNNRDENLCERGWLC